MADTIYTKTGHALAVQRLRYPGMAQCENCDDLRPDSTRERCRIHVRQTGHTVRFLIEDVTTYAPLDAARASAAALCADLEHAAQVTSALTVTDEEE